MKKINIKASTIICLLSIILLNAVLIIFYYNFYLNNKISNDIIKYRKENHEYVEFIANNIYGFNIYDAKEYLDLFVKENKGYYQLKKLDGSIIFTNKKDINKLFSSSILISIDFNTYELTYSKTQIVPGLRFIKNFILFEIMLIIIIVFIIYIISSKQIIDPINNILKDITGYKYGKIPKKRNLPDNMKKIQNTFVDMVDYVEIEKENKNQMIAAISHDIKTPLTSIMGYADRLKNSKLSKEKKQEYINKIYDKSYLMKEILEEFDDYQTCSIKELLKFEDIKVSTIKEFLINDYKDDLSDKKINFVFESNCLDDILKVDIVKIKRVFSNIISNSVRIFNGKSGLIKVLISKEGSKHKIQIMDNAKGIDNSIDLKKIFKPLYTTDKSRKISGLGLSICYEIIKAHGGVIYACNNNINGLSIIIEL